jgi:hypothetical protein
MNMHSQACQYTFSQTTMLSSKMEFLSLMIIKNLPIGKEKIFGRKYPIPKGRLIFYNQEEDRDYKKENISLPTR